MNNILEYIQLVVWVATASGLYWKMKNDITLAGKKAKTDNKATIAIIETVKEEIKEIKNDREKRQHDYKELEKKTDDRINNQCKKLNDIAVGIAGMCKDIKWIVKKIDK